MSHSETRSPTARGTTTEREDFTAEPGSFRDPATRVFYTPQGVLRTLSQEALADWTALASTRFYSRLLTEGKLVETEVLDGPVDLPGLPEREAAAVLHHETIPFVSYP